MNSMTRFFEAFPYLQYIWYITEVLSSVPTLPLYKQHIVHWWPGGNVFTLGADRPNADGISRQVSSEQSMLVLNKAELLVTLQLSLIQCFDIALMLNRPWISCIAKQENAYYRDGWAEWVGGGDPGDDLQAGSYVTSSFCAPGLSWPGHRTTHLVTARRDDFFENLFLQKKL